MTRLSNVKIRKMILKFDLDGIRTSLIAKEFGITSRRVQQLVKLYREQGTMPKLDPGRRPRTELTIEQKSTIDLAWEETRLSAKLLYFELKNRRKMAVPKNKIYRYLKETGRVMPDPKKQKKRKRCRYERKHSGSLVHSDLHDINIGNAKHVIVWLDDASRLILAGGEFETKEEKHSIATFLRAFEEAKKWNVRIRQVNTDHGSEYGAHGEFPGQFSKVAEKLGVELILSRIKNPQTNGKNERLWLEYKRHRERYQNFDEWKEWYNTRLHGALDLNYAENPLEAFQRKMLPEEILGLAVKTFGRGFI